MPFKFFFAKLCYFEEIKARNVVIINNSKVFELSISNQYFLFILNHQFSIIHLV